MSSLIFYFWRVTFLTSLRNGFKLLKDKALEIIPKYGRTEAKVGLGSGKNNNIWSTTINTCLNFKMLSVVLSELVFTQYRYVSQEMKDKIADTRFRNS